MDAMNKIKFSIIIPHKNIPYLLKRCLNSIPERKDIEIIVIDDNSDSQIVDFNNLPCYNRNNIKYILTKEGKGAGYARNIGLQHANGKWIMFADADDFYDEKAWDKFDEFIQEDSLDIIYFSVRCVKSSDLSPFDRKLNNNIAIEKYLKDNNSITLRYTCWEPWNKIFKHEFITKHNIKFEEIIRGNDAMFVLTAGHLANKIAAHTDKLYIVTYRENSISYSPKKDNKLSSLYLKIRINKFYKKIGRKELQLSPLYDVKEAYTLFGLKEAIKYINILIKEKSDIIYFIITDISGFIRLLKKGLWNH